MASSVNQLDATGAVGAVGAFAMALIVFAAYRRLPDRTPYLSLVFAEAGAFFLSNALGAFPAVALALGFASTFVGVPSVYLAVREFEGKPARRAWPHYLPAIVNIPLGSFAALYLASHGLRGGYAVALYYLALTVGQTVQLVAYARKALSSPSLALPIGAWTRRIARSAYAGYALFALLGWASLVGTIASDVLARRIALVGALTDASVPIGAFVVWTIALCALWGRDYAAGETGDLARYGGKALDERRAAAALARVRELLSSERNLASESVSPRRLAERLGEPYYVVSRAVNELAGMSVADLVNEYRVERAKRLLESEPDWSILDVALESGFLAKSTFNEVFKRATGLTPKDYRANRSGLA